MDWRIQDQMKIKEKWKEISTEYPVFISYSLLFLINGLFYGYIKHKYIKFQNLTQNTTFMVERSFQGRFDLFREDIKGVKSAFSDDLVEFRTDFHQLETRINKIEKRIEILESNFKNLSK